MDNPEISVIVPVYNVEIFLDRCLESLLNQTMKNIEIILVDDGSPDNSGAICDSYAEKYSNIKVIHKINGGLGSARNAGLEIASGKFVGFIDSDDFVDLNMFEDLYNFAITHNLDASYSAGFKFYNNNKVEIRPETTKELLWDKSGIRKEFLPEIIGAPPTFHSDVKYAMSVCRGIYSLGMIKNNSIKFVSEREYLSEDIIFNIDYLSQSQKVGMIPKSYYYYCYNEGSLTRSYRPDMLERMNKLYYFIKEKLYKAKIYDYANLNLDRLYLSMIRGAIKSEFLYNKDIEDRKFKLKNMYNDKILVDIFDNYPSLYLPIKHKVFFYLLKYRISFIFRVFSRILAS